jgi:peptidase E
MINRAVAQWTVDVATGLRERLPNEQVADDYAAKFVADGSKGTAYVPTATKDEVDEQGFTKSQREFVEARLRITEAS